MAKGLTATLMPRKRTNKERIFEVDLLRGFDVFLMFAVHFCFTMQSLCASGIPPFLTKPENAPGWVNDCYWFCYNVFVSITQARGTPFFNDPASTPTRLFALEVIFAGLFAFLCGVSCAFSRNNKARAFKLAYLSLLLSVVLFLVDCLFGTGYEIYFGILQALAIGLVAYAIVDHFAKDWKTFYGIALCLTVLTGIVLYNAWTYIPETAQEYSRYWYTMGVSGSLLKGNLTINPDPFSHYLGMVIGLYHGGDDRFSPLLITTVVFYGAVVGKTLYKNRRSFTPKWFPKKWATPLLFLGKHCLVLYLLHEAFLYVILSLVMIIFGGYTLTLG